MKGEFIKSVKSVVYAVLLIFLSTGHVWAGWYIDVCQQLQNEGSKPQMGPYATQAQAQAVINSNTNISGCLTLHPGGSDDNGGGSLPAGGGTGNTSNQILTNVISAGIQSLFHDDSAAKKQKAEQEAQAAEQQRLADEQEKAYQAKLEQEKQERIESKMKRLDDSTVDSNAPQIKRLDDAHDDEEITSNTPKIKRLDEGDDIQGVVKVDTSGWAQITFDNFSKQTLNLYLNGSFACGPVLPGGFCTHQVKPRQYRIEARTNDKAEGVIFGPTLIIIHRGNSQTWPIRQ